MKFGLLSSDDMKAMDALKAHHGGAAAIAAAIREKRSFQTRKTILAEKGYGAMIEEAEALVKRFARIGNFERAAGITYNDAYGVATAQVSGFQGAKVTFHAIKRMAESADSAEPCWAPSEMISVVPMTERYVYSGDLMATLCLAENILGASKFCSTNLIGTPLPKERFTVLEDVTGRRFETAGLDGGLAQIVLKNQGTAFGNLGGIEVANDNHLVYLDGVTRAAVETGGDFYLNPSWSSIVAACYYARDIPELTFKISMLLATQNLAQFRMLLNIMSEYLRDDHTTPIYEINIGNAVSPHHFIQCAKELDASGIEGISLAAHIRINPDLGMAGFDWTENAFTVLQSGTDMTFKYESDGTSREMDTMAAYFLSDDERDAASEQIGEVIYHKALRASKDGREMMRRGIRTRFGRASY